MAKRNIAKNMHFSELLTLHQIAEGAIPAPNKEQLGEWATVRALMDAGMVEARDGRLRLTDSPAARYWNKVSQIIHETANVKVAGFEHRPSIDTAVRDPKFGAQLVKVARTLVDTGAKVGTAPTVAACW